MPPQESETLKNIHRCAAEEFAAKGFRCASLRAIVRNAGVTTGAFYGYYQSKEALFDALVREQAEYMIALLHKVELEFNAFPKAEQPAHMGHFSSGYLTEMLDYAYAHLPEFQLILCASEGTRYENFTAQLAEIQLAITHRFTDSLREAGYSVMQPDPDFERLIVRGMYSSFFELIIHPVPRERAERCLSELHAFYTSGWAGTVGLRSGVSE